MLHADARPLIQSGDILCIEARSLVAWFHIAWHLDKKVPIGLIVI